MIVVVNLSALVLRDCFKKLLQAFFLILFFGSTFILLGKQLYKGVLTQKCVSLPPINVSDAEYAAFVGNSSNWLEAKNGRYLCGNSTGSRSCPLNYTCLKGANTNTYISHFNFYGSSVVTISHLMTLHFWHELYQKMLLTAGTLHVSYFVLAFYSFLYSSGLILAIITRSYKNVLKEREIIKTSPQLRKCSSNNREMSKGIAKSPSCRSYELFSTQVVNNERVESRMAEIIESVSRAAEKNTDSDRSIIDRLTESKSKREAIQCQFVCNISNASLDRSTGNTNCFPTIRQHLRAFASHNITELVFMLAIVVFLMVVIAQYSYLNVLSISVVPVYYIFALISFVEVVLKMVAYTPAEYFRCKWNAFDSIVLILGGSELLLLNVENPILFILRIYKLLKPLNCCVMLLAMKNTIGSCLFLFRHSMSILIVFITICIVIGMQLYGYEYFHSEDRFPDQNPPRWYFKDIYSSFLLVFCMLCGDWKQPMVNTVLFTSYASDLLMLIFVLVGNFVVLNLFLGIVYYTFFYNSKDILQDPKSRRKREDNPSETMTDMTKSKNSTFHQSVSSFSKAISTSHDSLDYCSRKTTTCNQSEMDIVDDASSEYVDDCCPDLCYFCCPFCRAEENPILWQSWADARCRLYWFVETTFFRATVAIIVIMNTAVLIAEQSHESRNPQFATVIKFLNPSIFFAFFLEIILKWMAYGVHKFFKSYLGRFEFFIFSIYLIELLSIKFFDGQKVIFKALRAFRLLSLTSLLKSYQETVPLPMKRNNCTISNDVTTSNESLLRQLECNKFLGARCRYRPTGSGELFQMDWNIPEINPSYLNGSRVKRIKENLNEEYHNQNPVRPVLDCLPTFCYSTFPICKKRCCFSKYWSIGRNKLLGFIENQYFFYCIAVVIVVNCIHLAFDLNYSTGRIAVIETISNYADTIFASLFFTEMVLKMFAFGLKKYFTDIWFIAEFIITIGSIVYAVFINLNMKTYMLLKIIKVFRLLQLHRILGFNKQSKILLKSLKHGLVFYILVFIFIFYLWLVFAIVGIALFHGKMYECVDSNNQILTYMHEACILNNGTFTNRPVNFDSLQNAFIALLQVASLQNWMSFVTNITDHSNMGVDIKNKFYTATFFSLFILFSTYLTLHFFVGITCWFFNRKESEVKFDSEFGMLNPEINGLYRAAVKKMEQIKLQKAIPPPKLQFQVFLYQMVSSDNFEIAGFVFIGLHMLLIALDMYDPDPSEMFALAMTELNVFFIVIFTIECILKLLAYRQHYITSLWNLFDVIVLALCICGILFEDLFSSPMLPAMLRLIRLVKCRRYLRRYSRGMLPLLYSLYISIPAFATVVILQFIVMFIYAVFGVYLFYDVKQSWDMSGELSFETFPKAMLLLFQMSTLAGWVDVLYCLSESGKNQTSATLFVVSYIIIVYYIIIKLHFLVILHSFDVTMHEYENIPLKEDYEMFGEVWQKFDSNALGVIKFSSLPNLLDMLEEPFHFSKPNRILIATLNIPIYEGDLVFYADVMDALTQDFMERFHNIPYFERDSSALHDNKGKTLQLMGFSLWRQRQNHCACVIQKAWRRYSGKIAKSPVFYSEVRLADQGDKVDIVLAPEKRSVSHSSV